MELAALALILDKLGFNVAYIVAGFSGGVVTLVVVEIPRGKAALTVLVGALVSNYFTRIAQHYLQLPSATELGCAFIVGIAAIQIVKRIHARASSLGNVIPPDPDTANKGA